MAKDQNAVHHYRQVDAKNSTTFPIHESPQKQQTSTTTTLQTLNPPSKKEFLHLQPQLLQK